MAVHRKKHNGRGEIFSPRIFQKLYSLARISEFFLHARLLPIFYFLRLETLLANLNIKNLIDTISICKLTNMTVYYLFRKPGAEWWWHTKGRNLFQTFSLLLEITLAATLAVWGSWLLVNKSWTIFAVATIIFIPSFILFLSTDYKKYPLYHSIWHIGSAAIMILVLI